MVPGYRYAHGGASGNPRDEIHPAAVAAAGIADLLCVTPAEHVGAGTEGVGGLLPVHFAGDTVSQDAVDPEFQIVVTGFRANFPTERKCAGSGHDSLHPAFLAVGDDTAGRGIHTVPGRVGLVKPRRITPAGPLQLAGLYGLAKDYADGKCDLLRKTGAGRRIRKNDRCKIGALWQAVGGAVDRGGDRDRGIAGEGAVQAIQRQPIHIGGSHPGLADGALVGQGEGHRAGDKGPANGTDGRTAITDDLERFNEV